jgi:HYR domain-containing protein
MKRAAFGLLCLFILFPAAVFAQSSITSFGPTSFYSFEFEQNATIHGVDLFGDFYGAPDSDNIFLSTQLVVSGPAGTFTEDISGGFRQINTLNDTIFMAIPDSTLLVEGTYSVYVIAHDDTGDRLIGPVYYDVIARPVQQNPLLSIPENVFAQATSAAGANVTFFVSGTSFVDPAPVVTCDHNSGDLFHIGETIVHCTATDSFGSASGSFPVFVLDTDGPTVTVPADIVTGNPVVTFTASATDVIDGSVTVHCNPESGDTFDLGTTVVQCIAYDSQGNAGFGSFNVTVSNGPVLTLPANITAEATSASGAAVSFTVTATDNATVVCTPPSGSTFALGTTTVNCTATASTGSTSGSFTVTVVDTTPPALTLPGPITAEATGPSGAAVTFTVSATDLVDGSRPVTCDHASGSTFALGTTTVQCTATDTHNNTAHGSFTVTVQDTTPPTIVSITASPSNLWPPNHNMSDVTVTVIATDLVDPAPTSHIVSVSSNQADNENGDGNTTTDWIITGALTLQLRAERDGNSDRIYTITIATTDFSGNTAHGTVTVTVSPTSHGGAQNSAPAVGRSHAVRP